MSDKRHQPTDQMRQQVKTMAGFGIAQDQIACVMEIDPKTLRLHYRLELDTGSIVANARVAERLFQIATGSGREAVTACIFWLKTRAGWTEYSPPPPLVPDRVGKKEQAEIDAGNAAEGTSWGSLVRH